MCCGKKNMNANIVAPLVNASMEHEKRETRKNIDKIYSMRKRQEKDYSSDSVTADIFTFSFIAIF